jgi:hypothetical protein
VNQAYLEEVTTPEPEVHLISGARQAHSEDQDRRMRRYLISMAIRTACVVLAVIVDGPLRWVFFVGAVILPYIAVVMANAVGERRGVPTPAPPVTRPEHIALPPSTVGGLGGSNVYIPEADVDVTSPERVIRGSGENTG